MPRFRENGIFDVVIITSALHIECEFRKQILHVVSKTYLRDNLCQPLWKYA